MRRRMPTRITAIDGESSFVNNAQVRLESFSNRPLAIWRCICHASGISKQPNHLLMRWTENASTQREAGYEAKHTRYPSHLAEMAGRSLTRRGGASGTELWTKRRVCISSRRFVLRGGCPYRHSVRLT